MSIQQAKTAVWVWNGGLLICLAACLAMLGQVVFAAVPVGDRWPVYMLIMGGLLLGLAKGIEWLSRANARRVVRHAIEQAKR